MTTFTSHAFRSAQPNAPLAKLRTALLLLLALPFLAFADEWEYRVGSTATSKFTEHWKGTATYQSRYKEGGDHYRRHIDLGLFYGGITKHIDLTGNFRATERKDFETGKWNDADFYYMNATYRHKIKDTGVSHRLRFEYEEFDWDYDVLYYRIALSPPYEFEPLRENLILDPYTIKPFASYEVALDTNEDVLSHTYLLGLSYLFSDKVVGNLTYEFADNRGDHNPPNVNILSFDLKFLF
ncbi:DUF2490 domain-containing protein [Pelagicoccus mobilis]|uniref:DUF2490 domain-containing protein n=1 Tax=Pelagicoccus mobilis TaxID=415221 RepID=A0A934S791_9BACT|nr:DUF2490 domain-containing protein [Pelagicoccus mobilis]MBK1880644.1 DUF2490 domain-containing protein [Pelagicoccus mobilis]